MIAVAYGLVIHDIIDCVLALSFSYRTSMDSSVNTRPLLQRSESESEFDEDPSSLRPDADDDVIIKDTKPLFNSWEPTDR